MSPIAPTVVAAIVAFLWCVSYAVFFWLWGDEATYSKAMLRLSTHVRSIARSVSYTFGMLDAHLFDPTFAAEPATWAVFTRAALACSPVVFTLAVMIRAHLASDGEVDRVFRCSCRLATAGWLAAWFAAGEIAGLFLVPQHL